MPLIQIAAKLGVPDGTVRRWKSTQDWDGTKANARNEKKPNARKRGGQKGNKNAKGHGGTGPPGNTNALKHGGYSQIFWDTLTEDERVVLDKFYINRPTRHIDRLCDELHCEKSTVYRLKDSGLKKFTIAMYGILDL